MESQFFYTRRETIKNENLPDEHKDFQDSINVNKIIRSVSFIDRVLILLDDLHERTTESPDIDHKTHRMKGMIKKREVYQTEVNLFLPGDIERFKKLTSID